MVAAYVAKAFTQQETRIILQKLKESGRRYAAARGVRKTTVDELAEDAGISKGAFYKFYPSKEMLFFQVLEDMHTEIYQAAAAVLERNREKPAADRAAEAVLAACRIMGQSGMMDFMERDAAFLLRKVPIEVQEKHYHSDEVHVKELLRTAGLEPKGGMELAAAMVRGLFLTVSHRESIGPLYPEVLDALVRGACQRLFPDG